MENLLAELTKEIFLANKRRKHTVFFDFSGHVNTIDVHAIKGKWKPKSKRVLDYNIRLYAFGAEEYLLLVIDKIKNL
jgi:hypothetical protein